MKKLVLISLLFWTATPTVIMAQFSGGAGTPEDPYQVATPTDLNNVRNYLNSHFIQTADIDLDVNPYNTVNGWVPIGYSTNFPFTGTFNGQGFSITGLFINWGAYYGLFGNVSGSSARLENLHIVSGNITGSQSNGGAIVGRLSNGALLTKSSSSGTVSGAGSLGGGVGSNVNGVISYSYSTATVTGTGTANNIGGLVGLNVSGSSVSNSYATGVVSGDGRVGGLIGSNVNASVAYTYSSGSVSGVYEVGGLISNQQGALSNSFWNTETSGQPVSSGAVGLNSSQMRLPPSFTGWDFDTVWEIDHYSSFPVLQQNSQTPPPGYAELVEYSVTPENAGIGTSVTISGADFSSIPSENIVWFGGVEGIVTAATPASLTATVPVGAGYGPVTVNTNGKSATTKNSFGVSFPVSAAVNGSTFPSSPDDPMVKIEDEYREKGSGIMADLDGDGKPDLVHVYTGPSGGISVFRNIHTSGSVFTSASLAARQDFATGAYPYSVQVSDLDNDGKLDLVVHNSDSFTVSILHNTSTPGVISFSISSFSTGVSSQASREAALGDVDGDGLNDIMVTGSMGAPQYGRRLLTFRNTSTTGSISFASAVISNISNHSISSISSADFDGDGKADAAISSHGSTESLQIVEVLRNTSTSGNISFSSPIEYATSSSSLRTIAAGDLNQDGLPEIAAAITSSSLNIFPNTSTPGNISVGTRQEYSSGEASFLGNFAFADVDGDGKPEVLYTTTSDHRIFLFPNTSSGGIVSIAGNLQYNGSFFYDIDGLVVGDANLDGKPDIMAMTYDKIGFFENRIGTAQFSPSSGDLGYAASGSQKELVLMVSNPGTLALNISSIVSNNGNFSISPTNATIAAGESQPFIITAQSSTLGVNNANFTFTHDAPNPVSVVTATMNVITSPKSAPEITAPSIGYLGFTANWEVVEDAASYRLDVSTDNTFSSFLSGYENVTVADTHYEITGLTDGISYYYRVRTADHAGGISTNSSTGSAKTLAYFAGGDGSVGNPFQVSSVVGLNRVRSFLSSHFIQTEDIDLNVAPYNTGNGWDPIGNSSTSFTGTYNGQGYSISSLYINQNNSYKGLFGSVSGNSSIISNVYLIGVNIITGGDNVGSIAGQIGGGAVISNSSASGTIASANYGYIGGLVGKNQGGIISYSHFSGTVFGSYFVGGISGLNENNAQINYSYSQASVNALASTAGGITGYNTNSSITNSYNSGAVSGNVTIGGLIGRSDIGSVLTNSYSLGAVTGEQSVGQVVGYYASGTLTSVLWNTETTASQTAFGSGPSGGTTGVTSNQMRLPSTFTGWDFDTIWKMDEYGAFPVLRENEQSPAPGYLPPATFSVNKTSLSFGMVMANTDNLNTFTVSNTAVEGSRNLVIFELSNSDADYQISPASASIAPGSQQVFTVNFQPTTTGSKPDSVFIEHNATGSPSKIMLSGSGIFAPNVAASNIIATATGTTSASIKWTPGNGEKRIVYATPDGESHTLPVNGNSYETGGQVIYNGTGAGDSVHVTSLVDYTNYTVRVYEYNGSEGLEQYQLDNVPSQVFQTEKYQALDPGNALSFDGINDHVTISGITNLSGNAITIEYWFKGSSLQSSVRQQSGINYIVSGMGAAGTRKHVISNDGGIDGGLPVGNAEDDNWHHVAMTWQRNTAYGFKSYLDGELVAQDHSSNVALPNVGTALILGSYDGVAENTNGILDEVRIWSVARTQEELKNYMFQPLSGTENGLTGYWRFDEGAGTQAYDSSPNNYNGNISGGISFSDNVTPAGAIINGTENGWYFLSNPTPGITLTQFLAPLWTQGAIGSDSPNNGQPNVFELNEATGSYQGITNLEVEAIPGKGYLVYVYKNDVYGVEGNFPKRLLTTRAAKPATKNLPVTFTPGSAHPGFNLVGNPHPNSIDLEYSGWQFTNVNSSVYIYDQSLGDYRSYNRTLGIGNNGGSRFIAPLQGFLVEASEVSPTLMIPDSAAASENIPLFKQGPILPSIQLEVGFEERKEQTRIVFHLTDNEQDFFGSTLQLEPLSYEKLMVYSTDKKGTKLDIGEAPAEIESFIDIPIGVESTFSGKMSMELSLFEGLPSNWELYLLDQENGKYSNIRKTNPFTFQFKAPQFKTVVTDSMKASPKAMKKSSEEITTETRFMLRVGYNVATSMELEFGIPESFALSQNYPNPFNPSTIIKYQLPVSGKVSLRVFDVLGREVATLINGQIEAGYHQVTFDAQNLASGMYIYQLRAIGTVITKKLMFIK